MSPGTKVVCHLCHSQRFILTSFSGFKNIFIIISRNCSYEPLTRITVSFTMIQVCGVTNVRCLALCQRFSKLFPLLKPLFCLGCLCQVILVDQFPGFFIFPSVISRYKAHSVNFLFCTVIIISSSTYFSSASSFSSSSLFFFLFSFVFLFPVLKFLHFKSICNIYTSFFKEAFAS